MKGRNNGKKLLAVRIVAHAFEIIHLLTDQNPIQVSRCTLRVYRRTASFVIDLGLAHRRPF